MSKKSSRRRHSAAFKAKVAVEAIQGVRSKAEGKIGFFQGVCLDASILCAKSIETDG